MSDSTWWVMRQCARRGLPTDLLAVVARAHKYASKVLKEGPLTTERLAAELVQAERNGVQITIHELTADGAADRAVRGLKAVAEALRACCEEGE